MARKKLNNTDNQQKSSNADKVDEAPTDNIASDIKDKKSKEPLEKPPEGQMFIKVYSPFKSYFDALGTSISAANDTGDFDILAGHHRFLTLLSACDIQIRTNEGDADKIKIDKGIMYVKEDRVTVFLDV
jgi:hypothetical protein